MTLRESYQNDMRGALETVQRTEAPTIRTAANLITESIAAGGILHVFGAGHSSLLAREITGRAGGLVPVNQIRDQAEGIAERVSGYAEALLSAYDGQYELVANECLIVISNSGINALPIEIALLARDRGLHTIALTNVSQSRASESRHATRKRLFEIAEVVLDNHAAAGDAVVKLPWSGQRTGASSTVLGAFILQSLMLEVIEMLREHQFEPPILISQNLPGADDLNRKLYESYRPRLRRTGA